jgi:hypothetical protein
MQWFVFFRVFSYASRSRDLSDRGTLSASGELFDGTDHFIPTQIISLITRRIVEIQTDTRIYSNLPGYATIGPTIHAFGQCRMPDANAQPESAWKFWDKLSDFNRVKPLIMRDYLRGSVLSTTMTNHSGESVTRNLLFTEVHPRRIWIIEFNLIERSQFLSCPMVTFKQRVTMVVSDQLHERSSADLLTSIQFSKIHLHSLSPCQWFTRFNFLYFPWIETIVDHRWNQNMPQLFEC